MKMKIDLDKYRENGAKVFSGRENGKILRKKLKIDIAEKEENIEVYVPEDIYSINSSFFLGMFGPSIRTFGEEQFRQKYIFHCDAIIRKNIEDGISLALKESNALKD